jgi:hypothetical protein
MRVLATFAVSRSCTGFKKHWFFPSLDEGLGRLASRIIYIFFLRESRLVGQIFPLFSGALGAQKLTVFTPFSETT